MKKISILLLAMCLLGACAGMDYQYQRNMAVNAAGYGLAGAGAAAAIASVTHGNVGQAATIGAVAGAVLGAANTPHRPRRRLSQCHSLLRKRNHHPNIHHQQFMHRRQQSIIRRLLFIIHLLP